MSRVNIYLSIVASAFLLIAPSCNSPSDEIQTVLTSNVKTQVVETVTPLLKNFSKELKVIGSVIPLQDVDILPLESGQITSIHVDVGDYVSKGDVLVELYNPLISREIAALKVEAESAENAHSRLLRASRSSSSLVAAADLDEAGAESARATAALNAGLDRQAFLTVKAPFDGIITTRNVHPGALVENGLTAPDSKPMLSISSCKDIRILLPYPERDMRFINQGGEVELKFPDLDLTLNSEVSRVAASVNKNTRTIDVLVDVHNSDCTIRPGIYVEGSLSGASNQSILTLPSGVRFIKSGLPFASIVENGRVETIPITILAEDKKNIGVSADGITTDTQFIFSGRNLVSEGQTVNTQLLEWD